MVITFKKISAGSWFPPSKTVNKMTILLITNSVLWDPVDICLAGAVSRNLSWFHPLGFQKSGENYPSIMKTIRRYGQVVLCICVVYILILIRSTGRRNGIDSIQFMKKIASINTVILWPNNGQTSCQRCIECDTFCNPNIHFSFTSAFYFCPPGRFLTAPLSREMRLNQCLSVLVGKIVFLTMWLCFAIAKPDSTANRNGLASLWTIQVTFEQFTSFTK